MSVIHRLVYGPETFVFGPHGLLSCSAYGRGLVVLTCIAAAVLSSACGYNDWVDSEASLEPTAVQSRVLPSTLTEGGNEETVPGVDGVAEPSGRLTRPPDARADAVGPCVVTALSFRSLKRTSRVELRVRNLTDRPLTIDPGALVLTVLQKTKSGGRWNEGVAGVPAQLVRVVVGATEDRALVVYVNFRVSVRDRPPYDWLGEPLLPNFPTPDDYDHASRKEDGPTPIELHAKETKTISAWYVCNNLAKAAVKLPVSDTSTGRRWEYTVHFASTG